MDYEDFLSYIYTPLKSIELLSETIYSKCNEEWGLAQNEFSKEQKQELLSLNFSIKQMAHHLLSLRQEGIKEIELKYKHTI